MFKSVKLRLYPNKKQETLLTKNCGCTRFVYNFFLERRIKYYEKTGKSVTYSFMAKKLTELKNNTKYSWLKEVDSTSLQQCLKNLDTAYKNFFRRIKLGENSGFPKFKKKSTCNSFRCVMNLDFNHKTRKLKIGKHGYISSRGSFELLKNKQIRQITVTKDGQHWYASCLIETEPVKITKFKYNSCGIDVGIKQPLTVAYFNNTKFLGKKFSKNLTQKELNRKRYQRQLARKVKGSNNSKKAKNKVTKAFQKERFFRKNLIEQTTNILTKTFKNIYLEDLNIKKMTKSNKGTVENPGKNVKAKSGLNREMLRLGFSLFFVRLKQKAEERGVTLKQVNPKFTSQKCSKCGTIDKDSRKNQATFICTECGFAINADKNAAINILNLGLVA